MENCKLLFKNNDGSELYGVSRKKLDLSKIKNWEFNRPPDMIRIPEIKAQLEKQNFVDGFIYLFNKDGDLFCYDGIHRIEALKTIESDINHRILIHYYPDYNEDVIKNKFKMLNKCVPVPELYTRAHKELDRKNLIENIVKFAITEYKSMFKPTNRPNLPHENRDNFTNKIQHVIETLELTYEDTKKLLLEYNDFIKKNHKTIIKKLSEKQINKCITNNCYIFTARNWDDCLIQYYRFRVKNRKITMKHT